MASAAPRDGCGTAWRRQAGGYLPVSGNKRRRERYPRIGAKVIHGATRMACRAGITTVRRDIAIFAGAAKIVAE